MFAFNPPGKYLWFSEVFKGVQIGKLERNGLVSMLLNASKLPVSSKQTNACSKSTVETLEKRVNYVQVNNNDNRTTSLTSLWCFSC